MGVGVGVLVGVGVAVGVGVKVGVAVGVLVGVGVPVGVGGGVLVGVGVSVAVGRGVGVLVGVNVGVGVGSGVEVGRASMVACTLTANRSSIRASTSVAESVSLPPPHATRDSSSASRAKHTKPTVRMSASRRPLAQLSRKSTLSGRRATGKHERAEHCSYFPETLGLGTQLLRD